MFGDKVEAAYRSGEYNEGVRHDSRGRSGVRA